MEYKNLTDLKAGDILYKRNKSLNRKTMSHYEIVKVNVAEPKQYDKETCGIHFSLSDGTERYLRNTSMATSFSDNDSSYYTSTEEMREALFEEFKKRIDSLAAQTVTEFESYNKNINDIILLGLWQNGTESTK